MPSRCRMVDLPAPEGPMMETNSPSLISRLMRRNTNVLVGPCSKYFSTFRRTIIGVIQVLSLNAPGLASAEGCSLIQKGCDPREDTIGHWAPGGLRVYVLDADRFQGKSKLHGCVRKPQQAERDHEYRYEIDVRRSIMPPLHFP